ncbi:MAG: hypothetical protein ACKODY_03735 [Actinomycetota bacterium]
MSEACKNPTRPIVSTDPLEFALVAKVLVVETRRRGLMVPGFRSPPRIVGVDRSLRRVDGHVTVAVRVKGRPLVAVVADMIEGVVVANRLVPPAADRLRRELWSAVASLRLALPVTDEPSVTADRENAA